MSWLYHAPDRADGRRASRRSSRRGRRSPRRTSARSRPATRSARRPRCSRSRTRSTPAKSRRASTATSPATRRSRSASSRRACRAGCRSSSAPTRSRRRATSCRSSRGTSTSASARSRPRTRSPPSARRSARRSAARSASRRRAGPGIVLKQETIGLAVTLELPLVIIDVQRAGPSTGMPTKTEQADLLMAMYGRNSRVAGPGARGARRPATASTRRSRRARIALKYRTPVFLLSDAYLANGAEPWLLPDLDSLPDIDVDVRDRAEPGRRVHARTCATRETLARPWAIPGTPGLEHRIGGLEKEDVTGNVSYDPDEPRADGAAARAEGRAGSPPTSRSSRSTTRRRREAARPRLGRHLRRDRARPCGRCATDGGKVAHAHLRHLNPFPRNLGDVLRRYDTVLVPEMNLGQLLQLVRAEFLVDADRLQPGARAARSRRPSWPTRSRRWWMRA